MKKIQPLPSLMICLTGYLLSFLLVISLFKSFTISNNILITTFVLDLIATFVIFLLSMAFNNSSFYDPYWSLAPLPIFLTWSAQTATPDINIFRQWIIIILVFAWSFRLTYNWIRRWKGMADEDWRYAMFRSESRLAYWLVSFFGFHVFPTIIVFIGCLSAYPAMCLSSQPLGTFDVIASLICLVGITIESIADRQLKDFQKTASNKSFLSYGLWKYSRHPNYFGEIVWWTGLFVFSAHFMPFKWYTLAGPVAMIIMFTLISIPMMDKRMMTRKPGYADYAKKTSALLPWPWKI
ncbi:MAG: DUF1295 domain-containing protein [Bacteroidales bacterium]|nr:DUF1295 domain-containing protein [Bacteroidales bacterium]MBN2763614.1 DUF1295 domain-containing protein [Bacteroidales bacterium]